MTYINVPDGLLVIAAILLLMQALLLGRQLPTAVLEGMFAVFFVVITVIAVTAHLL